MMKHYTLVFDATLIASGYHSGIYFVAYQMMLALLKEKKFRISFYFDPKRVKPQQKHKLAETIQSLSPEAKVQFDIPAVEYSFWGHFMQGLSAQITMKPDKLSAGRIFLNPSLRIVRKIVSILLKKGILPEYKEFTADAWVSPVFAPPSNLKYVSRKKNFISLYDTIPVLFPELHTLEWKNPVWWYARVLNTSAEDCIYFAISESTKKLFLEKCPWLHAHQITTTPLAADSKKFYVCDTCAIEKIRKKYAIPPHTRYMFSLATLEERKNLLFIVETYLEFIQEHRITDFYFLLAGGLYSSNDPRQQKIYNTLVEYAKQYPTIRLLGYVPDEDLAPLYSGADFFVYPSLFEGFGLPILEAMQCKTAVITNNCSSLPEVAGDSAVLLPPCDREAWKEQIRKFYSSKEERDTYAAKGLLRASQFSWERFQKLINGTILDELKHITRKSSKSPKKQRPVMIFNATILAEGFHSGLYNTAKNLLHEFIKADHFRIKLLFFPSNTQPQIQSVIRHLPGKMPFLAQNPEIFHYSMFPRYQRWEFWLNMKISRNLQKKNWKYLVAQALRPLRKLVHYQITRYTALEQQAREKFYQDCDVFFDPLSVARGRILENPDILRYTFLHDTIPHALPHLFPEEKRTSGWYAANLASFQMKKHRYFCCSESTKKDLLKIAHGAEQEQIIVVPHGVDRKIFHPAGSSSEIRRLKQKYQIPVNARFAFSLCSLEKHKNLLLVVETFLELLQEREISDFYLVLGGGTATGNQNVRTALEEYQRKSNRLIITGYLSEEELPLFYSHADFFVFDSLYEGFGLPVLEAMQCGCPVITSSTSSLPEITHDAALLVDPHSQEQLKQAMKLFIFDPSVRQKYKARALARSCFFSWKRSSDLIHQTITDDLAQKPISRTKETHILVPPPLWKKIISKSSELLLPYGIHLLKERLKNHKKQTGLESFVEKKSILCAVNKNRLNQYMKKHPPRKLRSRSASPRIIISMTSYPQRMHDIHYALYSLFRQTHKIDKIVLWLGEDKYPNREADLPQTIRDLEKYGLEIRWRKDLRAYTKLIYSLQEFPEDIIVTADDDIFYPEDWLDKLLRARESNPSGNEIIAHRTHLIQIDKNGDPLSYRQNWSKETGTTEPSFRNFLTGVGGVLYPPHCFHPDVMDMETAMKLTPYNDDIWFYAMALRRHTRIHTLKDGYPQLIFINPERELRQSEEQGTLAKQNVVGNGNDIQMKAVMEAYPELRNLIYENNVTLRG